jgi:hypothetical protein
MRRTLLAVAATLAALVWPAAAHAAPSYTDADYLGFADRIVAQLDSTWDPAAGYYKTSAPGLDSRYNAALLTVFATAAATDHRGPSRNDARARELADKLTQSPPFSTALSPPWADPMFHTPGWVGVMTGSYDVMDKAIDPKIAEGLTAAWLARDRLQLPADLVGRIADEISGVAYSPFFRYPNVRLNQINWPAELYALEATVTGTPELLLTDYRRQVRRFVAGIRHPWTKTGSTTLSPTFRFHYQVNEREGARRNVDSAEYANMTIDFLSYYPQALAAGMKPLRRADMRLLRSWARRDLFGYWLHSGFLNWDSGLGYRRWMKAKTWAYALQGLLTLARASAFEDDPGMGPWAKELFDRSLDFYDRQRPAGGGLPGSAMFDVDPGTRSLPDSRILAARMAANAVRAVSAGLGRMPGAVPPPFYSYDPDVGRLAISTPTYGTAVVAVNRSAFPYGGIELARLYDGEGDPIGPIGARPPATFDVEVSDRRGRHVVSSAIGRHASHRRPPLLVRTPRGVVRRSPRIARRPFAGPFRTIDASGRRRTRELELRTHHHFDATTITEAWQVRRRRGHRRFTVRVLAPSWGTTAAIAAQLRDGTFLPLVEGTRVALADVRRFRVSSDRGGYWLTPLRRVRGVAAAVRVAAQRSAPTPGPTLQITLAHAARFDRVGLTARISPVAARPG